MVCYSRSASRQERREWWRRQPSHQQSGNLSVTEFCRQLGIHVSIVHYWRKRIHNAPVQRAQANDPETPIASREHGREFRPGVLRRSAGWFSPGDRAGKCVRCATRRGYRPLVASDRDRRGRSTRRLRLGSRLMIPQLLRRGPHFRLHETGGHDKTLRRFLGHGAGIPGTRPSLGTPVPVL